MISSKQTMTNNAMSAIENHIKSEQQQLPLPDFLMEAPTEKPTRVKYICLQCGLSFIAPKGLEAKCSNCQVPLQIMPSKAREVQELIEKLLGEIDAWKRKYGQVFEQNRKFADELQKVYADLKAKEKSKVKTDDSTDASFIEEMSYE